VAGKGFAPLCFDFLWTNKDLLQPHIHGENNMFSFAARYKEENRIARDRLLAGSQLIDTSMGVIEAAITGQGSAVLISHGSGGGYDMGLWLAGLIGGQFQYIAPSRFGYLRSPVPPNPSPETQADTYAALLDTFDVDTTIIIGLSGGGASALQFALRHSERCRGLIMISAVSRSFPSLSPFLRAIYPLMLQSNFLPWLLYSTAPQAVFQGNGVSRALLTKIKPDREKMRLLDSLYHTTYPSTPRRDGLINDMQQLSNFPVFPLDQISVPTLVVHAVNDPIMPFSMGEFTASTIPNALFLKLDDGGHFTCVTHREEVLPVVQEFLIHNC
jgi:pimeloyl-ACP methyl ester carboxylesterase